MKNLSLILLCLISTLSFSQSLPEYNGTLVNDFANIIPDDQEQLLIEKVKAFENQTNIQMVVVTVNNTGGNDISVFAHQLFNKWGVGQAGVNNGIMILVAPSERKWRIIVGSGLSPWITEEYSKSVGEQYLNHNFATGNYYNGINILSP